MLTTDGNTVSLGIDLVGTFRPEEALTLQEVAKLIRGRRGRINIDALRRWATRGCRPAGERGPRVLLPTIRWNGVRMSMLSWIETFEKVRIRLASLPAARPVHRSRTEEERACRAAMARLAGG